MPGKLYRLVDQPGVDVDDQELLSKVVLCFLPDLAGDMSPHAAHGMVANLTVTD